jgi:hypothetical protein
MHAVEREDEQDRVIAGEDGEGAHGHRAPGRVRLVPLLVFAAAVRIPFVLLPPAFSGDVWRHRWDGRVLAAGLDPYRFAPSALAGSPLADAGFAKINHPEVPTVYGPLAEGLLALVALSPARGDIRAIKAVGAAFDVSGVAALFVLGASPGAGPLAAFLWAVHPLAVIETAGEGHLDGVAVSLLLWALVLLQRSRSGWASVLFAAAGLVKLTPLFSAPAFLRSAGRKGASIAAAIFGVAHLPFLATGGEFAGLRIYARSWEANGAVYPELVDLLGRGRGAEKLKETYGALKRGLGDPAFMDRFWGVFAPEYLARGILSIAFLLSVLLILRKTAEPVRASGFLLVALLLFSPTLHPWYLLNVLPFALLFRWWSVAWVAGAAPLVYAVPAGLARAVEFLPALALFLLVDRKRR